MCRCPTSANVVNATIGVTAFEVMGPNPKRKAILFQPVAPGPGVAHSISLSLRADVALGAGTFNYVLGEHYESLISDDDLGTAIGQPWWIICGDANIAIQITEVLYDE